MDLADLLTALYRRWMTLLLVVVPITAGAFWYATTLPATYEVQAVVAFQPRPGAAVGADVVRLILPRYTAILAAPATASAVADEIGISAADLEDALFVTIAPETSNLEVSVDDTDPERAARIANASRASGRHWPPSGCSRVHGRWPRSRRPCTCR